MPSETPRQRRAAGIALAVKRGKVPKGKLKGPAKEMAQMSESQLEDFAERIKPKKRKRV